MENSVSASPSLLPRQALAAIGAFVLLVALSLPTYGFTTNFLQNCGGGTGSWPPPDYVAGQPVQLLTCRTGAGGGGPYLGTYTFTSSDSSVVPPPPHTYTLAENASYVSFGQTYWVATHAAGPMVVFLAPGRHGLTLTFSDGAGVPGYSTSFEVNVIAPEVVPTLTPATLLMLALLLPLAAVLARRTRARP